MTDPVLSEHFSFSELTITSHVSLQELNRSAAVAYQIPLLRLCTTILEPIRAYFGVPVKINSGFRCLELNTTIGGSKTSQHMRGEASDLTMPLQAIFDMLRTSGLKIGQCILEGHSPDAPTWLHVSTPTKGISQDFLTFDGKRYHRLPS